MTHDYLWVTLRGKMADKIDARALYAAGFYTRDGMPNADAWSSTTTAIDLLTDYEGVEASAVPPATAACGSKKEWVCGVYANRCFESVTMPYSSMQPLDYYQALLRPQLTARHRTWPRCRTSDCELEIHYMTLPGQHETSHVAASWRCPGCEQ